MHECSIITQQNPQHACVLYVRLVCVGFLYTQGAICFFLIYQHTVSVLEKCRYYKGSTMEILNSADCMQEIFALGNLAKDPQN